MTFNLVSKGLFILYCWRGDICKGECANFSPIPFGGTMVFSTKLVGGHQFVDKIIMIFSYFNFLKGLNMNDV